MNTMEKNSLEFFELKCNIKICFWRQFVSSVCLRQIFDSFSCQNEQDICVVYVTHISANLVRNNILNRISL